MNIFYSVFIATMAMASHSHAAENTVRDGAASRLLEKSKGVVGRVKVVGSDNGFCQEVGLPNGCDSSFSFNARQYADGSVDGQMQDCFGENCISYLHGQVTCIKFLGNKKAIVGFKITGASDDEWASLIDQYFVTFANEGDGDGTDIYSFIYPGNEGGGNCDAFIESDFAALPHVTGSVKVQAPE